jgi:hypothetical protein
MIKPKAILQAAAGYVRNNPDELVRATLNAAGLKFGIPLAALRYFAEQIPGGKKAPKDVSIGSTPPALRLSAVVDAMGTAVRASATIRIEEINVTPETIRVAVRLRDVKLELVGDSESPVATLIKSGALDLSKPGNLLKFIPKKPPAIVEAGGDRIVIDLLKVPKIAENEKLRRALSIITPMINIGSIETDQDHLYVKLKATPLGLLQSMSAIRGR